MGWTDRVKAWFGAGDAAVPADVAAAARGVAQGSPDAITVRPREAGPVVGPYVDGGNGGVLDQLAGQLRVGGDLLSRYIDYEMMDDTGLLSAALDVYADDATVTDVRRNHLIWPVGNDRVARDLMADLLYKRLKVEDDAWAGIRTMCKYGNMAAEIVAGPKGVLGLNYMPPATVRKVLDHKGQVLGYVQSVTGDFGGVTSENFEQLLKERAAGPNKDGLVVFAPWEVVWWQMPSKQVRAPYGVSVLDAARWTWKRLTMLEDAAIVYRLQRAPARYAIYVECGQMPPRERIPYLQQVKQLWKKKKVIDPATGQLDFRASPMASDEDLFIPVTDGREQTRVDVLAGPEYNIIDDLEYFRAKLVAETRVPKPYMGLGEDVGRQQLSQQDVMFCRTAMRVQKQYMAGIMQVARLHFALLDVDPDRVDMGLDMSVPSSILEMSQMEAANSRAALAQASADFLDRRTILVDVLGRTEAEAEAIIRARRTDAMAQASMDAATQAAMMGGAGLEGGIGAPESDEDAMAQAAEVPEAMRQRLDRLSEELDRMGVTARRTEERMQRLPRELRRLAGGKR